MIIPDKSIKRGSRARKQRGRNGGGGSTSVSKFSSLTPGFSSRRFTENQTSLCPFPFRWNAKLTYGVNFALGTPGSSPAAVRYRLCVNGMYDPDITSTGHQPYQWDQLIAIYTKYIAKHAYVALTFTDPTIAGLWVGWSIHTNTTSNDDPAGQELSSLVERPNYTCVPISTAGNQAVTCEVRIPLHEVFGISAAQYAALPDVYGAAYNSNPVSMAYLDVFVCDPNSNIQAGIVRVVGRIVYDTQFFDYAAPAQS